MPPRRSLRGTTRRMLRRLRRPAWRVAAIVESVLRVARHLLSGRPAPTRRPMPVTFLVWNVHVLGGTARTIVQQANALAERGHRVTIISVERRRTQDEPFFSLDPRVRLRVLLDHRQLDSRSLAGLVARRLHGLPSVLIHPNEGRARQASLLTDLRLLRALGSVRRGAVVGSRLGLNLVVARFAHPATTTIAQEHLYLARYEPPLPDGIRRHFPKLDGLAVLTEADADDYRRLLAPHPLLVATVPNAVADPFPTPTDPGQRRVVAVAHLTASGKGMDRVIPAFANASSADPDWELALVGAGSPQRLEETARRLGVSDRVHFTGPSREVMSELLQASVLVMPSRSEAFSLVLIEGMAAGLAVVSFDCRQGPRAILTPGHDALVVPQDDTAAFSAALERVITDEGLRRRLGHNARRTAWDRYRLSVVTEQWIELFQTADVRRVTGSHPAPGRPAAPDTTERRLPSLPQQVELALTDSSEQPERAAG